MIITPDQLKKAHYWASDLGCLNRSIRKGEGNVYGFLGEFLVADLIGAEWVNGGDKPSYDYDLLFKGHRIDVKTKSCTSEPQPSYLVSIMPYYCQKCDYYAFARVLSNCSMGWYLGSIKTEEFMDRAKFYKKGEVDPSSAFGWTFKADGYHLPISELTIPDFLK